MPEDLGGLCAKGWCYDMSIFQTSYCGWGALLHSQVVGGCIHFIHVPIAVFTSFTWLLLEYFKQIKMFLCFPFTFWFGVQPLEGFGEFFSFG